MKETIIIHPTERKSKHQSSFFTVYKVELSTKINSCNELHEDAIVLS